MIRKFSSLKLLDTFTKDNLSVDIRASILQSINDTYNDIVDDFDEIVDLVNSEDGCTVYGLVKRGLINYVSLLGNDINEPGDNKVRRSQLMVYIFTHQRNIISSFLQFMGDILTTSNFTFLHSKYVIAINLKAGMPS